MAIFARIVPYMGPGMGENFDRGLWPADGSAFQEQIEPSLQVKYNCVFIIINSPCGENIFYYAAIFTVGSILHYYLS